MLHKIFGSAFILLGIALYPTPLPGTTILVIVGLVWLIGERRSRRFLMKIFGPKIFRRIKAPKIIDKARL